MKRLAATSIALVSLLVGLPGGVALAADGVPDVQISQATFEMSPPAANDPNGKGCPKLPAGTTISGTGQSVSVTLDRTDRSGIRTIRNVTTINGTADDQNANRYVFHYNNEFRMSNTLAQPAVFSGTMSDLFVLTGRTLRLRNGFVADFTTDAGLTSVTWKVRRAFGDPILFAPGPVVARCDPL
jgi:hypothetical protein